MNASKAIQSIGSIAGEIQLPVRQIQAIAERYQIHPELTINHVPHFSGQDVTRIVGYARQECTDVPVRHGSN